MKTLADLHTGNTATIKDLHFADPMYVKRLYGMGLRSGKKITVLRKDLTGHIFHVTIGTTELAIRQKDAENIHIF